MSKKIGAQIQCASCGHPFNVELYRSLWIDNPANRQLIFSNKVNRFDCPKCRFHIDTYFPFLAVNTKLQLAVWYEPEPDPAIDKDVADYRKHMGADSFYAKAPRIADWETFKARIVQLENRPGGGGSAPNLSPEMRKGMGDFLKSLGKKK